MENTETQIEEVPYVPPTPEESARRWFAKVAFLAQIRAEVETAQLSKSQVVLA